MFATYPNYNKMEKILENTYRNINIGLINEMAIICEKMGIKNAPTLVVPNGNMQMMFENVSDIKKYLEGLKK